MTSTLAPVADPLLERALDNIAAEHEADRLRRLRSKRTIGFYRQAWARESRHLWADLWADRVRCAATADEHNRCLHRPPCAQLHSQASIGVHKGLVP